jgi:multidrug transporter EmrE-like cation transporter
MTSPIDLFFKLGDKVTRGDPRRQQDFTYYMLWILFLAFAIMFLSNLIALVKTPTAMYAVWTMVGFAVMSLQFFGLKAMYDVIKLRNNPKPEEPVESVEEMLQSFKSKQGGNNDIRKKASKD